MTSTFPDTWKHAKVVPIPKSSSDFRPISILPFLSKALESIIYDQINKHLTDNSLLSNKQSGFRSSRSCITALVDVSEDIRRNMDQNKITFLLLLDHTKAFDSIDHPIEINKLRSSFGFSTSAADLINSYLSQRSQIVCHNNKFSKPLYLNKGVPQGSILGPILFSCYINDLPTQLENCNCHLYADDVQIYKSCDTSEIASCVNELNHNLRKISAWAASNKLKLNPSKSQCIIISKHTVDYSLFPVLKLNGDDLNYVETAKNLGITFDQKLSWNNHICKTIGKVYGMLRALWVTQHLTPIPVRILLVKTYLLPTLCYGSELFAGCDALHMKKLNTLYNSITRYVYGLSRGEGTSQYSVQILGVSFENFLKMKCLRFLHKII